MIRRIAAWRAVGAQAAVSAAAAREDAAEDEEDDGDDYYHAGYDDAGDGPAADTAVPVAVVELTGD